MTGLPDSIFIALWIVALGGVGSCRALALAWLFDGTAGAALPLVMGGMPAGAAEWILRRHHR